MPSFDIVSETDMQEVDNAVNLVTKEIGNRYDFKTIKWSIELNKKDREILINAESDYALEQVQASLKGAFTRRNLDARALDMQTPEKASGNSLRQKVKIKQGLDQDNAKKITKAIKESKMKVQGSVQGDTVRVTGKKIDDLQEAIAMIKGMDLPLPLQYINFRD